MLTSEQIQQNKLRYFDLLTKLGIDLTALTKYLDEIGYFVAPANASYYGAYPGGLCEFDLNRCYELGNLANAYFPGKYSEQDIIIVGLLSNIYRAVMYECFEKNTKVGADWVTVPAYRIREERPVYGELGFSSYMILKNFIALTDEQIEAIVLGADEHNVDIYKIRRVYPLVNLARMANQAAMYID